MTSETKVLIVEDNELHAEHISFCTEQLGFNVVDIVDNAKDCLSLLNSQTPSVLLLDISIIGNTNGIELASLIRQEHDFPIIFTTSLNDRHTILQAAQTEPDAYLNKPIDENDLAAAIEIALYKRNCKTDLRNQVDIKIKELTATHELTEKEVEILTLIIGGFKNKQIAEKLFISINTVKYHSKNLYLKLDVKSKVELTTKFIAFQ